MAFWNRFFEGLLSRPGSTQSGRSKPSSVAPTELFKIPAAQACIHILTSSLSRLSRLVAKVPENSNPAEDEWEPSPSHYLNKLFMNPSRMISGWAFWEWFFRKLISEGNTAAIILRNATGNPIELQPCDLEAVTFDDSGTVYMYRVKRWGFKETEIVTDPKNILVLHGPGFDGLMSPSPITGAGLKTLEVMNQAIDYQNSILGGINLRSAITVDGVLSSLSPESLEEWMDLLKKQYKGARKSGSIPVLPPGFDLKSPMTTAGDSQLIQVLKWNVEDIARVFNVPPRMIMSYEKGMRSTNSIEQQSSDFVKWSLNPHIRNFEDQATKKLLTKEEITRGLVIKMPSDALRMGSWSENIEALDQAVARAGIMLPDEARKILRLPKVDGGDKLIPPKGAPAPPDPAPAADPDD